MAKNPYRPGVGTRPPYLAGREQQIHRFQRLLEDYLEAVMRANPKGIPDAEHWIAPLE